ncbi:serine hydrolase [Fulvivirga sp. M361]|uniref:serine hydrolase n=1 Tax=Fulvivirga sp. M361 TaxID=2594266 RepID=UPI001179F590|nr:serine hydrolase [Fulvivirga sp. M361]TRX61838.1 serine hydrolase [Fulvivirga sp. M361]
MKYFYFFTFSLLTLSIHAQEPQELYFPPLNSDVWETTDPASFNWCETSIDALYDYLAREQSKSFMLLKDGKIVLEKYFGNYTQDSVWFWFSAGKSLMAVLTGIAQAENLLDINDKTSDYLGAAWTSLTPAQEAKITIRNQLTMTSGVDETDFFCSSPECLIYKTDAGTRWVYHNGPYSLLRNVIENAAAENLNLFTNSHIKEKIGMSGVWVKAGFNSFFVSRARDMARFGLMVQAEGQWNDSPILSDMDYYKDMINTSQELNPSYGYLWWLNGKASHITPESPTSLTGPLTPDAPDDTYTAAGSQGQFISISPQNGMILIRQGAQDDQELAPVNFLNDLWARIMSLECQITATEIPNENNQVVYPQPATKTLTITGPVPDQTQITNLAGRPLNTWTRTKEIDISGLSPGIYILTVVQDKRLVTHRIIKR